jgi:hypothetical protein
MNNVTVILRRAFFKSRPGRADDLDVLQQWNAVWTPLAVRITFSKIDDTLDNGETLNGVLVTHRPGPLLDEYETQIYEGQRFGIGVDLNLIWTPEELGLLSGWTYGQNESLRVQWANPGNVAWALQMQVAFLIQQGAFR